MLEKKKNKKPMITMWRTL